MIKFTLDLSNPEALDLIVRKTVNRRETRIIRLISQIGLALASLYVLYKWLCPYIPSPVFPVLLLLLLGLALSIQKQQSAVIRKKAMSTVAANQQIPEYTVDEDGVHAHRGDLDKLVPWSEFADWGTSGNVLYLEAKDYKLIVCHQSQLSAEDFKALQALAAAHIQAK